MNVEEFREYCLSLKGVEEKMPFVNVADRYSRDVLCFYVGDKWAGIAADDADASRIPAASGEPADENS